MQIFFLCPSLDGVQYDLRLSASPPVQCKHVELLQTLQYVLEIMVLGSVLNSLS